MNTYVWFAVSNYGAKLFTYGASDHCNDDDDCERMVGGHAIIFGNHGKHSSLNESWIRVLFFTSEINSEIGKI